MAGGVTTLTFLMKFAPLKKIGFTIITGAADDDPSAIGTYASAGARFGPAMLWTAPVLFPMMYTVVYLSSKLGQVTGEGVFQVIRRHYSRWILYPALVGVVVGNIIEAAADLGGMAAAIGIFIKVPHGWIVTAVALLILTLQMTGSYETIKNTFRWLALTLLTYVGAAILAKPELGTVLRGTLIPQIRFDRETLSILVALVGTALSAYLYSWQSSAEVEEKIAEGRVKPEERKGTTERKLRATRWDVRFGMLFASLIMYFVILSTSSTLYKAGKHDIQSAAEAAQALTPIAGKAAGILFAAGLISVGFLAVPTMTTGAAYDVTQSLGWKYTLHARPGEARKFYVVIVACTVLAVGLNFLGFNPMRALVWAGIVQGFSTPPLLLMMLLMTNRRSIMGDKTNSRLTNVLGWITVTMLFAATIGLVVTWIM